MRTYRLKQWYPGLNNTTKVGEEVTTINQYDWIKLKDGQNIHTSHLKYTNFWEEVLDYEILKFCPIEGIIYSVKRLLDNEVFSLSQEIQQTVYDSRGGNRKSTPTIERFQVNTDNSLSVHFKYSEDKYLLTLKLSEVKKMSPRGYTYTEEEMIRALEAWGMCKVEIEFVNKYLGK